MQKSSFFIFLLFLLVACNGSGDNNNNNDDQNDQELGAFETFEEKISYCIGLDNGNAILQVYNGDNTIGKFSMTDIQDGIVDYLGDDDLRIPINSIDSILNLYLGENGTINDSYISKTDASYAIGLIEGQTLVGSLVGRGIDQQMEIPFLIEGIVDGMKDESRKIELSAARKEVGNYYSEMNKIMGESFLANNAKNPSVNTTESGLQYEVITEGTGRMPNLTDTCIVHYTGRFIDGRVFETTIPSQQPAQFTLMGVIEGWQEGLMLMKEGGSMRLFLPYQLAYGENGSGPIEPYSTLVFDIELLRVNRFSPQ
ncbi:FKBP-type peptidyl-prolyl cis-trans isomerase [Crocinitomix sp.]|nr:FKBP-type peptidyl-prolyl cis-trans isomerase [Crocinitomix sp.]